MSEIPPKHTPDTSAYETPETGGGLVAMYNAASHAGAESFPVLKAFQDYLEAERAQARKRVVQLSVLFAVLMTVVVGGFLTAGIAMWRSNDQRVDKLLEAVISQKALAAPAPAPSAQLPPALEASVQQMSRVTTERQSSMDRKLDTVNEMATKVHEKVASQDGELEKLRTELRQMQEQSAKLKDEIVSIKVEGKKTAAVAPPAAQPRPPAADPAAAQPAKPAPPAPVIAPSPAVAVAPAALAAATKPAPDPLPAKPARDPRFPPAVKEPPATPAGVTPPPVPPGMMATAIPLKTKNVGTIPWRVLIPE